jgi:hypothetical protein
MNIKYIAASLLILVISLSACNLEKQIEIELPEYASQPVLECYLEPGKAFRLLLSKSNSYFDPIPSDDLLPYLESLLISNADVRIRFGDEEVVLNNQVLVDFETGKFYNYSSAEIVPENFSDDFELEIILPDGKLITANTRILPIVPIDSISIEKNAENKARCLIYVKDNPNEVNYYRRMLHNGSIVDSFPDQDFVTDDKLIENNIFVFGTGYNYEPGDTIFNTIFHIDEPYSRFLTSIQNSISSNGNPFAQPGVIITNLSGNANAIGIFTGLSYDRVMSVVP